MDYKKHVKQLRKGNEESFNAIYHETKHAVYAMVLPILKDSSLAEDAMQDTYIKMIEKIDQYNPKYKFINWLLTIAKNIAIDMLRKQKETAIDSQENLDLFISQESSVEKQMITEYYLSLLPDEEKQIVLLKVVGDLKHKDIAKILDKPIGTITYLYQKALTTIKDSERSGSNEK